MFNLNKTKSLLLVAVLVVAASGGALAAAPTVDTESTNTTETTEINDAGTQMYNATSDTRLSWEADSPNSSIEISQDGDVLMEASPENYSAVDSGSDGNLDLWFYNVTLADDGSDYEGLEVGAGQNVTLNVTITNDTAAASPDTTNISYTFANSEEQALIASESPESEEDDSGLFGSLSTGFGVLGNDSDDDAGTTLSTDSTTVTENTETVTLDTMNSNLTDAFEASTSDASSGDLVWSSYTQVSVDDDAQYLPVFYEESSDKSWLNTSEDAYATLSSDGQTMTVHNPDALLDDDQSSATMDVTTVGDEQLGLRNSASMFSNYDAGFTKSTIGAFGALDVNGDQDFVTDELEA